MVATKSYWIQQGVNVERFSPQESMIGEETSLSECNGDLLLGCSIYKKNNCISYNLVAEPSRELLPSSHHTAVIDVGHSLYTLKAALCCYTFLSYGLHNPVELMVRHFHYATKRS